MLAYAYNSSVNVAVNALPKPAIKLPKVTKRAFAIDTLLANKGVLNTDGAKVFRKRCIDTILAEFPATTMGSVGAIYNDAKHILVNAGEIEPFGRHGLGRNKHSKKPVENQEPKGYQVPENHNWLIVNKKSGEIESSAESRNKANKAKSNEQKVVKAADYTALAA